MSSIFYWQERIEKFKSLLVLVDTLYVKYLSSMRVLVALLWCVSSKSAFYFLMGLHNSWLDSSWLWLVLISYFYTPLSPVYSSIRLTSIFALITYRRLLDGCQNSKSMVLNSVSFSNSTLLKGISLAQWWQIDYIRKTNMTKSALLGIWLWKTFIISN